MILNYKTQFFIFNGMIVNLTFETQNCQEAKNMQFQIPES